MISINAVLAICERGSIFYVLNQKPGLNDEKVRFPGNKAIGQEIAK